MSGQEFRGQLLSVEVLLCQYKCIDIMSDPALFQDRIVVTTITFE